MTIATFPWYIVFQPFPFILFIYLRLRCVSFNQLWLVGSFIVWPLIISWGPSVPTLFFAPHTAAMIPFKACAHAVPSAWNSLPFMITSSFPHLLQGFTQMTLFLTTLFRIVPLLILYLLSWLFFFSKNTHHYLMYYLCYIWFVVYLSH